MLQTTERIEASQGERLGPVSASCLQSAVEKGVEMIPIPFDPGLIDWRGTFIKALNQQIEWIFSY
jgi:hypothetical protein